MEEKRYPILEEEDGSSLKASEPAEIGIAAIPKDTILPFDDKALEYDVPKGTFGFYTDCLDEFQQHVEQMDAEIDNPNTEWIPSAQMWKELKEEFIWL